MKRFVVLMFLLPALAFAEDVSDIAPKSLVIIEVQKKSHEKAYCLGFLLDEYNVITASKCAETDYESMKVYRSLQDCNASNNSIPVELRDYQQNNPLEPIALALASPIFDRPQASIAFPVIDREEDLNCFFLVETNDQLSIFRRIVRYWDTVKSGVVKVTTPTTMSLKGKPVAGAVLFSSVGDITGISFEHGQLFSPMHGFLIPFYTVAPEPHREL